MQPTHIAAKEARIRFGELLERARYGGLSYIITKKGKPVARLEGLLPYKRNQKNKKADNVFRVFDLGTITIAHIRRTSLYEDRLSRTLGYKYPRVRNK